VALFGTDPLDELVVPDGTHVQEHDLVAAGDIIVASQSAVEFGVRGGNVIAGERVDFGGDIEAEGDCRLDTWCDIDGNVLVEADAYLGERVHIGGELRVAGNLDIGDDVQIDEGFEANGWIVIRNPMPTIVFLFIYLSQLLRIGEDDAAEELLAEVTDTGDRDHQPVLIPRGSRVGDDSWRVSTPGRIGDDCRLHGNIRAESLVVGCDTELFGSLRAREGVTVGAGTEVTGNVTTREGTVRIGPGTTIRGDVAGEFVEVHRAAEVEGAIRASEEMSMVSEPVLDDAVVGGAAAGGSPAAGDDGTPDDDESTDETGTDVSADDPDEAERDKSGDSTEREGDDTPDDAVEGKAGSDGTGDGDGESNEGVDSQTDEDVDGESNEGVDSEGDEGVDSEGDESETGGDTDKEPIEDLIDTVPNPPGAMDPNEDPERG